MEQLNTNELKYESNGVVIKIPKNTVYTDNDSPFLTESEEEYTDKVLTDIENKKVKEQNLKIEEMDFDAQIAYLLKGIRVGEETVTERKKRLKAKDIEPVRTCVYGRVSTKHDEQETSLLTQHLFFHDYVERHEDDGYVIVEEIYDQKTATLAEKRPRFLNMIERALKGDFQVILFKDSKRMCRNQEDFLSLTEKLSRAGVYCIFISEGVNTQKADRMVLGVLGMVAESHSNGLHKSVSIAKKIAMEREEGRVPSYCFGYDKPVVNNSSVMNINDTEAELVKELFIRYAINKEGVSTICDDWRARGIKSKTGGNVSTAMLNRMLDNKIYIGVLEMGWSELHDVRDKRKYNSEPAVVRYRPDLRIIPDELFNQAQEIRERNKAGHRPAINRRTAFSGKIQCACCGKNFKRFFNGRGKDKLHMAYYKCSTKKQGKRNTNTIECGNASTYRRDELLDVVATYFKAIVNSDPENLQNLIYSALTEVVNDINSKNDCDELDKEVHRLEGELKRTIQMYKAGLIEDMQEVQDVKDELSNLKDRQSVLKQTKVTKQEIREMVDILYKNINEFIDVSVNSIDKASDEVNVRFNGLFDSIISTNDGRIVFNMNIHGKGERYYSTLSGMSNKKPSDSLIDNDEDSLPPCGGGVDKTQEVGTLGYIGENVCEVKYLQDKSSNVGTLTTTNINGHEVKDIQNKDLVGTLDNTHNGGCKVKYLLSSEQIQVMDKISKYKYIININSLIDYSFINRVMNDIRDKDTESRRRYRYCDRYKTIGLDMIDAINIILK